MDIRAIQHTGASIQARHWNTGIEASKSSTTDANAPEEKSRVEAAASEIQSSGDEYKAKKYSDLSDREVRRLQRLKQIDTAVRAHEMAHVTAGGQYVRSGARFQYKRGPDGVNYAVAGEVSIDSAPVAGDPDATVQKMNAVQRAALAPADPSSQDRRVAAKAGMVKAKALMELALLQVRGQTEAAGETDTVQQQRGRAAYAEPAMTMEPGSTIQAVA